jgi:hypothetical protein
MPASSVVRSSASRASTYIFSPMLEITGHSNAFFHDQQHSNDPTESTKMTLFKIIFLRKTEDVNGSLVTKD